MSGSLILDTGPLVAFKDRRDTHHDWAMSVFEQAAPPFLTCEAVIAETCFLLAGLPDGAETVLEMIDLGAVKIGFNIESDPKGISQLMSKYRDVPMSLADACLVRMAERASEATIVTLDRDFRIYRMFGRKVIPVIMPGDV